MSENTLKNELLKQNGASAVDGEVSKLHAIIEAEQRRVRRLTYWTLGVWGTWILMMTVSITLPMVLARTPPPSATTQPVAVAPVSHPPSGIVVALLMVLVAAQFFGLPVAGIVLLILLIFTRRTAGQNQIRASLAAIEAQLKALSAGGGRAG